MGVCWGWITSFGCIGFVRVSEGAWANVKKDLCLCVCVHDGESVSGCVSAAAWWCEDDKLVWEKTTKVTRKMARTREPGRGVRECGAGGEMFGRRNTSKTRNKLNNLYQQISVCVFFTCFYVLSKRPLFFNDQTRTLQEGLILPEDGHRHRNHSLCAIVTVIWWVEWGGVTIRFSCLTLKQCIHRLG